LSTGRTGILRCISNADKLGKFIPQMGHSTEFAKGIDSFVSEIASSIFDEEQRIEL
jgi:hypothetical protein